MAEELENTPTLQTFAHKQAPDPVTKTEHSATNVTSLSPSEVCLNGIAETGDVDEQSDSTRSRNCQKFNLDEVVPETMLNSTQDNRPLETQINIQNGILVTFANDLREIEEIKSYSVVLERSRSDSESREVLAAKEVQLLSPTLNDLQKQFDNLIDILNKDISEVFRADSNMVHVPESSESETTIKNALCAEDTGDKDTRVKGEDNDAKQRHKLAKKVVVKQAVSSGVALNNSTVDGSVFGQQINIGQLIVTEQSPVTERPLDQTLSPEIPRTEAANALKVYHEMEKYLLAYKNPVIEKGFKLFKEENPELHQNNKNRRKNGIQDSSLYREDIPVLPKPETKTKSSLMEKVSSWRPFGPNPIIQHLQDELKELHQTAARSWRKHLPVVRICPQIPESLLFNFQVISETKSPQKVNFNINVLTEGNKRIFLQGNPRFGKTSFCKFLCYRWSFSIPPLNEYTFCFRFSLKNWKLSNTNFSNLILDYSTKLLEKHQVKKEEVQQVLAKEQSRILVFLEDFDAINPADRKEMLQFCAPESSYHNSTIVLTSRRRADFVIRQEFKTEMHLVGFSSQRLESLLRFEMADPCHVRTLSCILDRDGRLVNLLNLTPSFLHLMKECLTSGEISQTGSMSLHLILEKVLLRTVVFYYPSPDPVQTLKSITKKTGNIFLNALKDRCHSIDKEHLQSLLENDLKFLKRSSILYRPRNENGSLMVAHQLWLVYFAVSYLRRLVAKTKCPKKTEELLISHLCTENTKGRYVTSNTRGPQNFFVGSVSEIVVQMDRKASWDKVSVEMCYDVENLLA